jgi:hypothetical protein
MYQGLAQAVVEPDGSRDGRRGKHRAVEPTCEDARDDDGRAQRHGRNLRTRSGQPEGQAWMAREPGNDRSVDGAIQPVGRGLVREDRAEHRDEDRAGGQQRADPQPSGGGQQGSAIPQMPANQAAALGCAFAR